MPFTLTNANFSELPELATAQSSVTTWSRLEALPHTPDLHQAHHPKHPTSLIEGAIQREFGDPLPQPPAQ